MKWDDEHIRRREERKQQIEAVIPKEQLAAEYTIVTHDKVEASLTLDQVVGFKEQNKPKDFFLWLDESQGDVFVQTKPLKLGPRLRQVLRHLAEFKGQRVTHRQLVKACIGPSVDDPEWNAKTSRRWIINLRVAGKGQLGKLIKTKEGGFMYDGPPSFCIIKTTGANETL